MKQLFTFILFLFSAAVFANDFQPGKLFFANGKELTGLIKESSVGQKNVIFKASEKAAKEKFSSEELSKISFTITDAEPAIHVPVYKLNFGKKSSSPTWMQVLVEGPATLYAVGADIRMQRSGFTHTVSDISFYLQRTDEPGATMAGMYFTSGAIGVNVNRTFRNLTAKYFADYPELVTRIENKEFEILEIPAVVEIYNKWKSGKK